MEIDIIQTGSSGNATVLEGRVLIDCGVSYRKLEPYVKGLQLVLLTHQHSDHFKASTLSRLATERPAIRFACGDWLAASLMLAGVPAKRIDIIPDGQWMSYGGIGINIMRQLVPHDVPNCCWHIEMNGQKAFYVTDAGTLTGIQAKDYDLYMIEANRCRAELDEAIKRKRAAGEFVYEHRVVGTHLFREQAEEFLANNMSEKSSFVFMHEHRDRLKKSGA